MRGVVFLAVLVVAAVLGIGLAMLNTEPVAVNFHYTSLEVPLALLVGGSVALGALVGMVVSSFVIVRLKRNIAKLRRSSEQLAAGSSQIRTVPLKPSL